MFTALILICAGGVKAPDSCYYMSSRTFYETRQECNAEIVDAYESKDVFEFFDEELNTTWKMTDGKCVNWKELQA